MPTTRESRPDRRWAQTLVLLAFGPALALLGACGSAVPAHGVGATVSPTGAVTAGAVTAGAVTPGAVTAGAGRVSGPAGDCPPVATQTGGGAAVDFVDFVQWDGRHYLAATGYQAWGIAPVSQADLGPVVFTVGCSLGRLNDLTHASPPAPGDGDASYLAAGTPVYAVRGWPTSCRLAAVPTDQPAGTVRLYAALDPAAPTATPATCIPTSTPVRSMPATPGPGPAS